MNDDLSFPKSDNGAAPVIVPNAMMTNRAFFIACLFAVFAAGFVIGSGAFDRYVSINFKGIATFVYDRWTGATEVCQPTKGCHPYIPRKED